MKIELILARGILIHTVIRNKRMLFMFQNSNMNLFWLFA